MCVSLDHFQGNGNDCVTLIFQSLFLAMCFLLFFFFLFPSFRWTKNSEEFDPRSDPELKMSEDSGSFTLRSGHIAMEMLKEYRGKYTCYASNELGTAVSSEAHLRVECESTTTGVITTKNAET